MQFCGYRERTVTEVRRKLQPFCQEVDLNKIIDTLKAENFLNEERYTASFIRGKIHGKKWGRLKTRAALKAKNIPESLINKCLQEEVQENTYRENLQKLVEQYAGGLSPGMENKAKTIRYLLSKGYENELIWEYVGELD